MDDSPTPPPTARGDREQRHADVLAAARAELEERGWDDFSIRDIAARAGVSPGAVYQWFSGKGEIWARLQEARIIIDTDRVRSWNGLEPIELVRRVVDLIASNHADLGRHRFAFVRALEGEVPEYAHELTHRFAVLGAAIAEKIAVVNGLDVDGRVEVPDDQTARLSWLWAVGKGVGDHMVDARWELMDVSREQFLETTSRSVLAGLTAP